MFRSVLRDLWRRVDTLLCDCRLEPVTAIVMQAVKKIHFFMNFSEFPENLEEMFLPNNAFIDISEKNTLSKG